MSAAMNLSEFDNSRFDRGAGSAKEFLWLLARAVAFTGNPWPLSGLRRGLLRLFGATVGEGVVIKPQVKVTFPWKLSVGAHTWLGEEAWLLNLDRITIGHDACISQRVFLCTGSHDWSDPQFALITKPITIGNGVWLCADVFVGPGVSIGDHAVVLPGSVVTKDLPPGMVCSGNPCVPVKPRVRRESPVRDRA
ncbi:MAG: putative colanic acid biosynthesis acetyltransferase [Lentisphaerae bacterium]|nr:putative colanic acid biosynthesis acetyltransferase [Lentisphaerota bacterium]